MQRIVRILLAVVASAVGAPLVALAAILGAFVYLPLPTAVLPPVSHSPLAQENVVYDSAGQVIARFGAFEHQVIVPDSQIPAILKEAVVASEDKNFFHEGGVSVRGILRALWTDITSGGLVQGGSTITEQYVKNAYLNDKKTLVRKFRNAILAAQLGRAESKEQILYAYLSTVYLGEGAYGVGAAAEEYFRQPVSTLDASQAAMLAGLLPAPSYYDPLANLAGAEARRETVLELMRQQGYLDAQQYRSALAEHLVLAANARAGVPVTIVYPPRPITNKYPFFINYLKSYLALHLTPAELAAGGLRIQSTLNPKMQADAEAAVASHLAGTSPPLQEALVSVQPASGYVVAMVGGRDYQYSEVNLALGGCPSAAPGTTLIVAPSCATDPVPYGGGMGRQPGSAFKPFTLATYLSEGHSPNRVYSAPAVYVAPGCTAGPQLCDIHNAESGNLGSASVVQATWYSINTVYVQIVQTAGIKNVALMAKKLGITSAYDESNFGISYTLGVIGVSPLDMASAYSVFANLGARVAPSPVVRVENSKGKVIYDDSHPTRTQVLSPAVAGEVTKILEGVIQHGTGYPNAVLNRPAAGKTGTTNGFHDGWFVGYTPQLSTAVWMGYENSESRGMYDIEGVPVVYGGTIPAATWHDFMASALAGMPVENFAKAPPLTPPPDVLAAKRRAESIQPGYALTPETTPGWYAGGGNPPSPTATPPTTEAPPTTTTLPPTTTTSQPPQGPGPLPLGGGP